ncbi:MAG TPA: alpha/beta fold hydrolase [Candidatus Dormibacteraeota bacterium]|nr:alpha/beta fold hydrolase [Candidatus Dormibacteraeota bacterium]
MTLQLPPPRPLYLPADPDVVFGMFHAPLDEPAARTAVLLLPPWGWDEIASYRSRRAWAEHLAEHRHPTLRIDFPGSGDSAGDPGDPARVEAWTSAVVTAASWLATATPAGRVAVIGLGLGGLIAGLAMGEGAPIDELVLWAAPTHGRSFLREQRAFGKLQRDRYGPTEGADEALPDGWLEIGGFVQSAETIAAVEQIDLRQMPIGPVQRVLLLGRDGLPVDVGLQQRLAGAGADVTVAPGDGWGAMCFHPERYQPPLDVFRRVSDWLGASARPMPKTRPAPTAGTGSPVRPEAAHGDLSSHGVEIRETPMAGDGAHAGFFAIVAERVAPSARTGPDLCVVFLNAGAVRRIGPNRMWVEASRRWAARGIPTARMDVEGIGDAAGDAAMYYDVGMFYTPAREMQVTAILDALVRRGLGPRFVLVGLCAGAYSAFNTAASDARVVAALAVNPRIMIWDPAIMERRNAFAVREVLELGSWQRILNGETAPARVLEIGRAAVAEAPRAALRYASRLRAGKRRDPWTEQLEQRLDTLRDARTPLVLAFSGDEPMHDELKAAGILDRLDRWPNVVLTDLPGDDHTLRPIAAQRAFHRFIDEELERLSGTPAGAGHGASSIELGRQPV